MLLEKLGWCTKKHKFVAMVKPRIWQAFCSLEFVYDEQRETPKDNFTKEEERVKRMNELKLKGKLSKRKQKELSSMTNDLKKRKKPTGDEADKRLHRAITEELKQSSAVVGEKKLQKTGRQILLKIFYICFRMLREHTFTAGFDYCVRAIERHSAKADPRFLKDIVEELKHAFEIFEAQDGGKSDHTSKQLIVLHAIIRISNEKSKLIRHGHRG